MECTSALFPPWHTTLIFHRDGEVAIRKWVDDGPSTTTPATTTIVANQLFCQLKAEAFDVGKWTGRAVVLHENERICYRYVQQKSEYVFIKFSALGSAAVVATDLVTTIHSPPMC